WFSGLFYIVRLFVYHSEAEKKPPAQKEVLQNQFKLMEKRLWYGITWPSAILTLFFGFWLVARFNYWTQPWMLLKFGFVAALFLYHLACGRIYRQLQRDEVRYSAIKLRIWNEVATLFLVAIVFIIVLKNTLDWIWGLVGLVLFAVVLMLAIRLYRKSRQSRAAEE
ncbi:MAG: CopD family protein, partial [Bacteroidota bacterium]